MAALRGIAFAAILCLVQCSQSAAAESAVKEYHDWKSLKKDLLNTEYSIVDFFASWCPHCVTLAPKYAKAAETISQGELKDRIKFIKVQCDDEKLEGGIKPICVTNKIQGFPSILVYKKDTKIAEYMGERTPEAIENYAKTVVKKGKAQFLDNKPVIQQQVCLAKDFKKYVHHKQ